MPVDPYPGARNSHRPTPNREEPTLDDSATKKLQRSAHDSVAVLSNDIVEWVDNWNEDPKPFVWHKTADEILERLGRYCTDVTNTEFVGGTA